VWSGTGSNRRPSAFQVNRAERCADLQKRMSLTSETALGGRCKIYGNRTNTPRPSGWTATTPATTMTVVGPRKLFVPAVVPGCLRQLLPGDGLSPVHRGAQALGRYRQATRECLPPDRPQLQQSKQGRSAALGRLSTVQPRSRYPHRAVPEQQTEHVVTDHGYAYDNRQVVLTHDSMLRQRLDAVQGLVPPGSLPVRRDLILTKRGPLPNELQRPWRRARR
jgi:hypothetical protein